MVERDSSSCSDYNTMDSSNWLDAKIAAESQSILHSSRFEIQAPSRGASEDFEKQKNSSRKSSTSSSISSSEVHPFDTSRRPTLVRSSKTFDQDELPDFKKVRISNNRSTSDSSSNSSDDEAAANNKISNIKIVQLPVAKKVNNMDVDGDDTSSSGGSSDADVDVNKLTISHQQNGSMSSFENNVEIVDFTTPNIVYATESIVEDEPTVKQCKKGNFNLKVTWSKA